MIAEFWAFLGFWGRVGAIYAILLLFALIWFAVMFYRSRKLDEDVE